MGIVYEAEQRSLKRRVALKIPTVCRALLDRNRMARFQNEAQAAAMLKHAHIVSVFSVGCERGIHYYAMELIDGQSLAGVIRGLRRDAHEANAAAGLSMPQQGDAPSVPPGPVASTSADTKPVARLSTDYSSNRESFFRGVARLGIDVSQALHYAHQRGVIHRDIKPPNLLLDRDGQVHVADFGLARIQSSDELTMTGQPFTGRLDPPADHAGR